MLQTITDSILYKKLNAERNDLPSSLMRSWELASPLLERIPATHPFYTDHGPKHALATIEILDKALEPLLPNVCLGNSDLFILLAATILHDIGMLGEAGANESVSNKIRKEHHIRSDIYIRSNWQTLGIPRPYVDAIADVAAAHRKIPFNLIQERPISTEGVPHIRLCAALLRLADECHITYDRVPHDLTTLELPEASALHFESHQETIGCDFNAEAGTITFGVNVGSSKLDAFLCEQHKKFQEELASLQEIFRQYNIPYADVRWEENRDELICYKICRLLLQIDQADLAEIVAQVQEKNETVENYLLKYGDYTPYTATFAENRYTYALSADRKVFSKLIDRYLIKPQDPTDPLIFIRSAMCQSILNDEYLDSLMGKALRSSEVPVARTIIRHSPSALRYVFLHKDDLPARHIASGSGLLLMLLGEIKNDFLQYRDLLLTPGLLDDIFEESKLNEAEWKNQRIYQIVEYHKAFANDIVVKQWLMNDECKQKTSDEDGCDSRSLTMNFSTKAGVTDNPLLLLAASTRLEIPLEMECTGFMSITVSSTDKQWPFDDDKEIEKVSISTTDTKDIQGFISGRLQRRENGDVELHLPLDQAANLTTWNEPIHLFLHGTQVKTQGEQQPLKWNLSINWDLLDCAQAALMIDVSQCADRKIFFSNIDIPHTEESAAQLRKFFSLGLDDQDQRIITTLGYAQQLSGIKIPYPFVGLPDEVKTIVMENSINSSDEALNVVKRVLDAIDKLERWTISPVIVEVMDGERYINRLMLDWYGGMHMPRVDFHFSTSPVNNPDEEVKKAFGNPAQSFSVEGMCVTFSPMTSIHYMKEKKVSVGDKKKIHPGVLLDMRSQSVAEENTICNFYWEKAMDGFWYDITPFRCVLNALSKAERWSREGHYFSDNGDYQRCYIAAKEASRCDPTNFGYCISLGWAAFLVNRLDEAIKTTLPVLKTEDKRDLAYAYANLGLYYLCKAKQIDAEREKLLDNAKSYYDNFANLINTLAPADALQYTDVTIDDIEQYKQRLDEVADTHLRRLQSIREQLGQL